MRIGIVNDSVTARTILSRFVTQSIGGRVAWVAADGAQAVKLAADDTPDLILMDIFMPVEDGISATRRIMSASPCAILIVTANTDTHSPQIFQALGAGALDVVRTPDSVKGSEAWEPLKRKILSLSHRIEPRMKVQHESANSSTRPITPTKMIVAIGSSAGGPSALAVVLKGFREDYQGTIVIAQHLSDDFIEGLADWLRSQCVLPVVVAKEGEYLHPGKVYLADPSGHLVITVTARCHYEPVTPDDCVSPLVDRLFLSIAKSWEQGAIGVILTGMGADGAEGLLKLKQRGYTTIAESEESCMVFGMPGAAVKLGAATYILPSSIIAKRVQEIPIK